MGSDEYSTSTCTMRRCGLCMHELDSQEWFYFDSPCGHAFHFVCARKWFYKGSHIQVFNGEAAVSTNCDTCKSYIFLKATCEDSGIPFLMSECADSVHSYSPERIEFFVTTEIRIARPMQVITCVPDVLLQIRGLRCIDFQGFPIKEIPASIAVLAPTLYRFVLISLDIHELPDTIAQLVCLEQFLISGCPIRKLPEGVSALPRLGDYYFDGNALEVLPQRVPPQMEALKVSGNHLSRLPESFEHCCGLETIRAYGNLLVHLPESICLCDKVIELSVQGNNLLSLPYEIGRMHSLKYLAVHDNELEKLPESLLSLSRLQRLSAYNNHLACLPVGLTNHLDSLELLLLEGNPIDAESLMDVLERLPSSLRALGLDAEQTERYCYALEDIGGVCLPCCVVSGHLLHWDRLYAKLTPASQLRRPAGVHAVRSSDAFASADTLVVAFSASQGEPEWLGVLGKVFEQQLTLNDVLRKIRREIVCSFKEIYEEQHGHPPQFDVPDAEFMSYSRRAVKTAWFGRPPPDNEPATSLLRDLNARLLDFDILCLCDTNAQWYFDTPSAHRQLHVRKRLQQIVARYKKVMFVGASMGGFAALSHADLADVVAVFGPQTDLRVSHLRPGFTAEELAAASDVMHESVHNAIARGVRIEYHVAAEDHVHYAQKMKLPRGALIVHPLEGRLARALESAGLLLPLLTDFLLDLQLHPKRDSLPIVDTTAKDMVTWRWESDEENLLMGIWGESGTMSFCRISAKHMSLICNNAPTTGEWLCACGQLNRKRRETCMDCYGPPTEAIGWIMEAPRALWPSLGYKGKARGSRRPPYRPSNGSKALVPTCSSRLRILGNWLSQLVPIFALTSAGFAVSMKRKRPRLLAVVVALIAAIASYSSRSLITRAKLSNL